jgi:hypothetical protein
MLINLVRVLYGATGIITIIGYMPTIRGLLRRDPCANSSSYLIWTLTSLVSLAYAALVISDLLLSLMALLNLSHVLLSMC